VNLTIATEDGFIHFTWIHKIDVSVAPRIHAFCGLQPTRWYLCL